MENNKQYKAPDFKKGQPRWCPGCGDHFFLSSFLKALEEIGATPYDTVVVSGIGCSGRLPYYVNTYALQTIHGRAAAIATGIKVVNPKLSVWQVSGDGDGLADDVADMAEGEGQQHQRGPREHVFVDGEHVVAAYQRIEQRQVECKRELRKQAEQVAADVAHLVAGSRCRRQDEYQRSAAAHEHA